MTCVAFHRFPPKLLKRFADIVSAFENGRAGQDRPQWAQISRDVSGRYRNVGCFLSGWNLRGDIARHNVTAVLDPLCRPRWLTGEKRDEREI